MPPSRTGAGDPAATLALLWRHEVPPPRRRGPKARLDVDEVVAAAVALADEAGLGGLTMRALATRLAVPPMTLYSAVPGKAELLDLVLDALYLAMPRPTWDGRTRWRSRLRAVAEANRALYAAHPWAARVTTSRPPLGPGLLAKYEHELAAFDGTGLDDLTTDRALTFLLAFVRDAALAGQDTAAPAEDAAWWAAAGPLLERVADAARYPRATRVGTAAGAAQGAAFDPDAAYAFGLERVLDGLAAAIDAA